MVHTRDFERPCRSICRSKSVNTCIQGCVYGRARPERYRDPLNLLLRHISFSLHFCRFSLQFFFSTGSGVAWVECIQTRLDTWPIAVADGWAGVEMRVFTLSNFIITDRQTNGPTDQWTNGQTDKASYRVACPTFLQSEPLQ